MVTPAEFSKMGESSLTGGNVGSSVTSTQYPTKTYQASSTTNYATYSSGPQVVSTSYTSGPTTTSYTTGQTTSYTTQPMTTTSYMTGQPTITSSTRSAQTNMMMNTSKTASPYPINSTKTTSMMTGGSPMPTGTRVITSGPQTTTTTGVTDNGMSYTTTSTKQTSVQYTGESQQRYVPLGTQPVMAYPHNVRTLYDPNLVPAFVAPPQVSVTPGYVSRWPTQLTATQPQQPAQPF